MSIAIGNHPSLFTPFSLAFPSSISDKLLAAYRSQEVGWVMVPPRDLLDPSQNLPIGSGAIGFQGSGKWKLHISIAPHEMERALPILISVLHNASAPRLGFKIQTAANLASPHQIGKEVALIFDRQVELDTLNGYSETLENCLNALWNAFYWAQIQPESGLLLTSETMFAIQKTPPHEQIYEKQNLKTGKFDRAIPCPFNLNYFHYRNENFVPLLDEEFEDLKGIPGIYAVSDILNMAEETPEYTHNPNREPDPFLRIQVKKI